MNLRDTKVHCARAGHIGRSEPIRRREALPRARRPRSYGKPTQLLRASSGSGVAAARLRNRHRRRLSSACTGSYPDHASVNTTRPVSTISISISANAIARMSISASPTSSAVPRPVRTASSRPPNAMGPSTSAGGGQGSVITSASGRKPAGLGPVRLAKIRARQEPHRGHVLSLGPGGAGSRRRCRCLCPEAASSRARQSRSYRSIASCANAQSSGQSAGCRSAYGLRAPRGPRRSVRLDPRG